MAHDVFISYSEKDKETADAVCATLESEGIRCWIAPRDVLPSMEWSEAIIDAIEECRIMVLVFTANANDSLQIHREVERGANHGVAILPLRVQNVLPAKALEYFIGDVQWLDAQLPPSDAHLQSLAGAIKAVLAGSESVAASAASTPAPAFDPGREKAPAAGDGRPPSGPEKAQSKNLSASSSPRHEKARIPRAWFFAILGAVAALILLALFLKSREARWMPRNSGTTNRLISIFGTSEGKRLWAVGDRGTILESDDEGASWTARNSGVTKDLLAIFATRDGMQLWAVGYKGMILESDDGGATWTARNSGSTKALISIIGTIDGQRLWAVGLAGTILESDDEGASWMARNSGTTNNLYSIIGISDGQRLWAVGHNGTILGSEDGGATWTPRASGTTNGLHSIFGTSDGKRLWAVGDYGTILGSDEGGASWSPRNSGTSDWLHSIFGTSDGKRLWAVGNEGTILESDDGGSIWTARKSGTDAWLLSIFGTREGMQLWAVGDKGTILESSR